MMIWWYDDMMKWWYDDMTIWWYDDHTGVYNNSSVGCTIFGWRRKSQKFSRGVVNKIRLRRDQKFIWPADRMLFDPCSKDWKAEKVDSKGNEITHEAMHIMNCIRLQKMIRGNLEVRSDKSLNLSTFDI